jgi:hypothetical protein
MEYISQTEAVYLASLIAGEQAADSWSKDERAQLIAKLIRLKYWAEKEDAARARLRAL